MPTPLVTYVIMEGVEGLVPYGPIFCLSKVEKYQVLSLVSDGLATNELMTLAESAIPQGSIFFYWDPKHLIHTKTGDLIVQRDQQDQRVG